MNDPNVHCTVQYSTQYRYWKFAVATSFPKPTEKIYPKGRKSNFLICIISLRFMIGLELFFILLEQERRFWAYYENLINVLINWPTDGSTSAQLSYWVQNPLPCSISVIKKNKKILERVVYCRPTNSKKPIKWTTFAFSS